MGNRPAKESMSPARSWLSDALRSVGATVLLGSGVLFLLFVAWLPGNNLPNAFYGMTFVVLPLIFAGSAVALVLGAVMARGKGRQE